MKPRISCFLFLIIFCLGSCESKQREAPSNLRVVSLITGTEATLTIQPKNNKVAVDSFTFDLEYATPRGYQKINPGHYVFEYEINDNALLEKSFVIGSDGWYTLLIMGMKPLHTIKNRKTLEFTLEKIFAGSEAEGTNGYLPRWTMLRDNYDGSKKDGYIRILNASPTYHKLAVFKNGKKFGSIRYPLKTKINKLTPGDHTYSFYHGEIQIGEEKVVAEPGYIYTIIIGDAKASSDRTLHTFVLKNPSGMLLDKR